VPLISRLAALSLLLLAACSPSARDRPNVVLVTIESLRPDHVGCYGGRSRSRPEVPLTPALDALAAEGMRYPNAHAVTSWTLASHASLFTGLYPSTHRAVAPRDRLGDDFTTVAETLQTAGYQTAGVVSGPYLRRPYGLGQGFDVWVDGIASARTAASHDDVTNPQVEAALTAFLDETRDPDLPFFLFAYLWDPHYDYLPPPPYDTMFVSPECEPIDLAGYETNPTFDTGISAAQLAYVFSQYAGEIRATDDLLGRFFAALRAAGLWDDTVVVVTADHGEEFYEHGKIGHKNTVYAESVHVPLIV
jgi:arylsulfatase A-like enzyme